MAPIISHNSTDYSPVIYLPVIASFDSDGHIRPLYIRIEGESYKVNSFWIRSQFVNIIEFNCKIEDHGTLKPITVSYHIREAVWTTPVFNSPDFEKFDGIKMIN